VHKRLLIALCILWAGSSAQAVLLTSDLIARARTLVKDSASQSNRQQFSDAQYLAWASDGQREANAQNWLLQTSFQLNLVPTPPSLFEFNMPTDFLFPIRVWYQQPGQPFTKLPATSLDDLDARTPGWTQVQGVPISYFVDMGQNVPPGVNTPIAMGFYPSPITSSTGPVIIYYVQSTVDLTVANESAMPFNGRYFLQPYVSALPYYMAYRAYSTLEETDIAKDYLNYWVNFLLIMRQGLNRQPDFNPPAGALRSGNPTGQGGLGSP
jgi:hypothetical protein